MDKAVKVRRRGYHEGTINYRPNGRIQAQIMFNGDRVSRTFGNVTDARAWIREQSLLNPKGTPSKLLKHVTMEMVMERWLAQKKLTVKPATYDGYSKTVKNHLQPAFGNKRVYDLKADDIQRYWTEEFKKGRAPSTIKYWHIVLHNVLVYAKKRLPIITALATDDVSLPRSERSELNVWTEDQADTFLGALEGDRMEAFFSFALASGARKGEILGLRWSDINFEASYVFIQRTLYWLPGLGIQTGTPKTAQSRRRIDLSEAGVELFRRWQSEQAAERVLAGDLWQATDYVFTNHVGAPMSASSVQTKLKDRTKALGLPDIRFHDLRHTCATILLSQGVSPKVVQELLGHASIQTTLGIYGHVLPTMHRQAMQYMDRILRRSSVPGDKE